MSLGSLGAVFMGVSVMALGGVGVMSRLLVVSRIVVLRGGVVMFGSVLVMFRSLAVVLSSFHRHDEYSPSLQVDRIQESCDSLVSMPMDCEWTMKSNVLILNAQSALPDRPK